MAKLLALVYIRDVNLNNRSFQRTYAFLQGNTRVGVGSCVEHYAVVGEAHFLHLVDKFAFYVALIIVDVYIWHLFSQFVKISLKRVAAVNLGLSTPQQVQVGAVDNHYVHNISRIYILSGNMRVAISNIVYCDAKLIKIR